MDVLGIIASVIVIAICAFRPRKQPKFCSKHGYPLRLLDFPAGFDVHTGKQITRTRWACPGCECGG